jgi:pimeloyl-ACP methyl ester carboxylesterase
MSPVIRLGDPEDRPPEAPPAKPRERLRRDRVTVGGIETRAAWSRGEGIPTVLLHGWLDNCDTWLEVLTRLADEGRPAIAYDLPGFGVAPPLDSEGDVLEQLVDFTARAVLRAAERAESPVLVAGNSLGGWTALRAAERDELPIAGVIAIGPAGIRMAPAFFTIDRIPAVSQIISLPAPVPEGAIRSLSGMLYRQLAFGNGGGVEQAVVDRFTRFLIDRSVIRTRLDYAKRLRSSLAEPFDPARIRAPVTVLWGERDRLCLPAGATELQEMLPHARIEMIPDCGHTPQIECPERVVAAIAELAGEPG